MDIQRGLHNLVMLACVWQLMFQRVYSNYKCPRENDKYYNEGESVRFSCKERQLLDFFNCKTRSTHRIILAQTIGNISFTSPWYLGTNGTGIFDDTVVGWFSCMSTSVICARREFILGYKTLTSSYKRQNGKDIFVCDTLYPDMVNLEMYVNGVNVTGYHVSRNGTMQHTAPVIFNATCVAHMPCIGRTFYGTQFNFHDNVFALKNNETGNLNCSRDYEGTTSIQPVNIKVGGIFPEPCNNMTIQDDLKSTTCGWCVTVTNDTVLLSDVFTLNTSDPCPIAETVDKTMLAFVSDAGSSCVSISRGFGCLIIFFVNVIYYHEIIL
ncbi:b149.9 [miniopterid betaherpesvirus 1]|uniref:B149.9 n=1 Tax=miniopterid betaherpesvirus 1 TaxID=3070189 RepID=I3VQE2_9BETA|nr:b149.9 [miniopterid betaherpesvirus 1]AFK83986.1 b149.9 [miniopterid betaherpesvirus 1]